MSGRLDSKPGFGDEQNLAVVKTALEEHVSLLMRTLELRKLVAFINATHFDFNVYKKTPKYCIFGLI